MHSYEIGLSLRPKRGERVSGDSAAHFETEDGTLCLLLSAFTLLIFIVLDRLQRRAGAL